jgi:hypothetical protein
MAEVSFEPLIQFYCNIDCCGVLLAFFFLSFKSFQYVILQKARRILEAIKGDAGGELWLK